MEKDPEQEKQAIERLEHLKEKAGHVPVVNQILLERPDLLIPNFDASAAIFNGEKVLPHKTKHLIAMGAAVGYGSPYCIKAQMEFAKMFGATDEEILEALQIASFMGLTKGQSISFRIYAEVFGKKYDE